MDPDLASMRREYAAQGLDESAAGDNPLMLFEQWLAEAIAAGVDEPNAMALATASVDAQPSVRIVLLKGLDADGAVFFTGYDSRKGIELAANPRASAVMLWHQLQRQVRIEGRVVRVDPAASDAYFATRPHGAQVGAVASPQSQVIESRAELEKRFRDVEGAGPSIDRPERWGGYRLSLDVVEFWQGRENRLHDRLRFARAGGSWLRERLAP